LIWDVHGDIENTKPKKCFKGHHVCSVKTGFFFLSVIIINLNLNKFFRVIYLVQFLILRIDIFYRELYIYIYIFLFKISMIFFTY
jgi:hypothetical protein